MAVKIVETDFGDTAKMLVQHNDGWKVWGTVPGNFRDVKGENVRFEARVIISNDDPKFGFYSRPTKAEVVSNIRQ